MPLKLEATYFTQAHMDRGISPRRTAADSESVVHTPHRTETLAWHQRQTARAQAESTERRRRLQGQPGHEETAKSGAARDRDRRVGAPPVFDLDLADDIGPQYIPVAGVGSDVGVASGAIAHVSSRELDRSEVFPCPTSKSMQYAPPAPSSRTPAQLPGSPKPLSPKRMFYRPVGSSPVRPSDIPRHAVWHDFSRRFPGSEPILGWAVACVGCQELVSASGSHSCSSWGKVGHAFCIVGEEGAGAAGLCRLCFGSGTSDVEHEEIPAETTRVVPQGSASRWPVPVFG